jgi:hypothetical protein
MPSLATKLMRNVILHEPEVVPQAISPKLRAGRAHAQGFKTDAYRGGVLPLDLGKNRDIRWFSNDSDIAESYMPDVNYSYDGKPPLANTATAPQMSKVKLKLGKSLQVDGSGSHWAELSAGMVKQKDVKEALKEMGYSQGIETDTIAKVARTLGYDSVTFKNIKDHKTSNGPGIKPTTVYAVFKPQNIRGHLANFDPAKKDVGALLAGILATGGTGAMLSAGQNKDKV